MGVSTVYVLSLQGEEMQVTDLDDLRVVTTCDRVTYEI